MDVVEGSENGLEGKAFTQQIIPEVECRVAALEHGNKEPRD